MLSGGHNFFRVFPHLIRILCIPLQQHSEAQHCIHRGSNVMGHIGKKGSLGIAGRLCSLKRLRQLPVINLPLGLLLFSDPALLSLIEIIQKTAQEKRDQHHDDHDINILIHSGPFLLDCINRHISDQIDASSIHGPHIVQCLFPPNIMIEHDFFAFFQAGVYLSHQLFIANIIGPVKIFQVQVPCIPLSHSLGFEDKTLCLRIHDIQHGFLIIKSGRQGSVQGVVDIFHIKHCHFLPVLYNRTFHSVCPCAHIIYIRLGNCHSIHLPAGGKVQLLLRKYFTVIGNPLVFSCAYHRDLYHCLAAAIGAQMCLRILCRRQLLRHQLLEFRLFVQNRLYRALDQVQALTQILNRRIRHLHGNFP